MREIKKSNFETRMEALEKATDKHISRIHKYSNTDLLEIHDLFSDEVAYVMINVFFIS